MISTSQKLIINYAYSDYNDDTIDKQIRGRMKSASNTHRGCKVATVLFSDCKENGFVVMYIKKDRKVTISNGGEILHEISHKDPFVLYADLMEYIDSHIIFNTYKISF